MLVGVLALQGDVREHQSLFAELGVESRTVKQRSDLDGISGLVLPGGESTAQSKLLQIFGLFEPVKEAIDRGLPVFGTCAGIILLAKNVSGLIEGQKTFAALDIAVERNSYGSQLESFETSLAFQGSQLRAAFIRAPRILESRGCEVLAEYEGWPVIVRQGSILGATCHPEISGDSALHEYFVSMCRAHQLVT